MKSRMSRQCVYTTNTEVYNKHAHLKANNSLNKNKYKLETWKSSR